MLLQGKNSFLENAYAGSTNQDDAKIDADIVAFFAEVAGYPTFAAGAPGPDFGTWDTSNLNRPHQRAAKSKGACRNFYFSSDSTVSGPPVKLES
jgi:hypothetical protein